MYEWDEAKNRQNLAKHGIDFHEASLIFAGPVLSRIDMRSDYGERRIISLGLIRGLIAVVVVHTERDGRTRIISARLANRRERKLYDEHHG